MASNIPIRVPYLKVQRKFPVIPQALSVELESAYSDIASCVNNREIALFAEGQNINNGKTYTLSSGKYAGFQRIYRITATGNTPHSLKLGNIFSFTSIAGTFTDGTNIYPLPYVNSVSATNQISLSLTSTNIVITPGGGTPPTFVSGVVILEWMVQV